MSEKIQGDLRLLTLLLTLRAAPRGLSKNHIYQLIPAYQQLNEAARERMFERDKATLKELDLTLIVSFDKTEEPLYSLQLPPAPLRLDVAQRQALDLAAQLWYDAQDWGSDHQLFRYKVDAFSFDDATAVKTIVSGGKLASSLLEAINREQAVEFQYRKLSNGKVEIRQVFPKALVFKDNALYLEGVDLVKEASRTFRLSRFVEDSLRILAANNRGNIVAALPIRAQNVKSAGGREITPLLWVADDFQMQASFWAAAVDAEEPAKLPVAQAAPLPGWFLYKGYPATFTVWLERIMTFPEQLLVAEAGDLQSVVCTLLEAASLHEGESDGN